MTRTLLVPACLAAILSAGCLDFLTSKTSPTPTGPTVITTGAWVSISSATALTNTCTDFHWTITDVTGTSGTGTFTAKCLATIQVAGTAHGTLSGTTVTWAADATGTGPSGAACPVALAGTATFDGTQFRIPYTGTTCLGPVSGAEVLRKG
jgi:hypothetical protein